MATIALWSVVVQPGKPTQVIAQSDIRITNAALGDKLASADSRTSVKLTYDPPMIPDDDDDDDEESAKPPPKTHTILCSLTPGKVEQTALDLVLEEDGVFEIEALGKNTIYLSGNYLDQSRNIPFNDEDDSDMDSEDAFDLRDVSSDVEINPDELDIPSDGSATIEEIVEKVDVSKTLKRSLDSDAMDAEPADGEAGASKKKRKKNKKLKGEDGNAVQADDSPGKPAATANGEKKENGEEKKKEKVKKQDHESPAKGSEKTKELPGNLKLTDKKAGTGPAAKKGDTVSMRYIGKLENGKIFDSNTKGKPFVFRLGGGEVIKGWDEGIVGMQVGGERVLVVPPKLAYGNRKTSGIPAGSTLKFECKLVEIK